MLKGLLLKNIFFLFLLLVLISACSKQDNSKDNDKNKTIPNDKETNLDDLNKTISFLLIDKKNRELNVTATQNSIVTNQIRQPLVLFNLFSSLCKPCMGQMPYLNEIQRMYQDELFVVGILVPSKEDKNQVAKELQESLIEYFISYSIDNTLLINYLRRVLQLPQNFSMPLSILYKNGKLYRYYEGAIPMEMLEIEIRNAQKLL